MREDEETDESFRRRDKQPVDPLTEAIRANAAVRDNLSSSLWWYPYPRLPTVDPGGERDPNAVYGPKAPPNP